MQQTLIVNGKEFLTASAAGKRFGYTRDYILLLAREKKIVGEKIQNKWYVDPDSVEAFCRSAQTHHAERKEQLRIARQREFQEKVSLRNLKTSPRSTRRTHIPSVYKIVALSFVTASFVVVAYLSFFVLPQKHAALLASTVMAEDSFFKRLAFLFYDLITPERVVIQHSEDKFTVVGSEFVDQPVAVSPESAFQKAGETALVAVPEVSLTEGEMQSLVAAFSDEVTVISDPQDERTGIVVPHFKDGSTRSYRFFVINGDGSSRDE